MSKMKKHTLTVFILLCFLTSIMQGQQKSSLLWKIEGKGIKTSYIFGTIHMMPQKDFVLPQKVKEAFENSEEIYLELDMDSPEVMQQMMKEMMMGEEDLLSNHVDSTEYKLLDSYLRENVGLGFTQFNRFKPLYMSSTIMSSMVGKNIASFEITFVGMAKEAKKELKGIETVSDQMSVFDSISYEKQLDDLVEMLEDLDETKELYGKMVEKYKSENIDSLYNFTLKSFDNDKKMIDALLHDRNKNWVTKIPKISKEKTILYAVGAGHLGGEKGIIQLLKEKGFTVTPIIE